MISPDSHAKGLVCMVILEQKACRGARGGGNARGGCVRVNEVQRSGLQKGSSAPCSTLQPVRASRRRCCSGTHQICSKTQRGAQPRSNRRSDESRTSGSGQSAGQKVQDMRRVRGAHARSHRPWRARVALSAGWRRQPLPKTVESYVQALQIGENSFLLRKRKELC